MVNPPPTLETVPCAQRGAVVTENQTARHRFIMCNSDRGPLQIYLRTEPLTITTKGITLPCDFAQTTGRSLKARKGRLQWHTRSSHAHIDISH